MFFVLFFFLLCLLLSFILPFQWQKTSAGCAVHARIEREFHASVCLARPECIFWAFLSLSHTLSIVFVHLFRSLCFLLLILFIPFCFVAHAMCALSFSLSLCVFMHCYRLLHRRAPRAHWKRARALTRLLTPGLQPKHIRRLAVQLVGFVVNRITKMQANNTYKCILVFPIRCQTIVVSVKQEIFQTPISNLVWFLWCEMQE